MEENLNTCSINYSITFYSQWHCGSGLSAGADIDELVVKDQNGMPYIPGKTLKGLIREAIENYVELSGNREFEKLIHITFGSEISSENNSIGCAHFANAVLCEMEYSTIVENKAQRYLYDKVTTTSIGNDGIAKEHSLRSIEVVIPCTLHATMTGIPQELRNVITNCLGLIKRLGQKRNRGLGRCDIKEEA